MNLSRFGSAALLSTVLLLIGRAADATPAEPFARSANFVNLKLSPKGDRVAVTRRVEGRVILAIIQLADMRTLGAYGVKDERDVEDFYWANNDRLLFGFSYHVGLDEAPVLTGDLYSVNADGSDAKKLIWDGYRAWSVVDTLSNDHDHVLINHYGRSLRRLDVYSGSESTIEDSRTTYGWFVTDRSAKARFQGGSVKDGSYVISYRPDPDTNEWKDFVRYVPVAAKKKRDGDEEPTAEESANKRDGLILPLYFAADDRSLYVIDNRTASTVGLYLIDPQKPEPELLFRNPTYDFGSLIPGRTAGAPIGVSWQGEKQEWRYFDPQSPDAVLFESIRQLFKGKDMRIVSYNDDRSRAVVLVGSDVDPGTFYVLDLENRRALAKFPRREGLVEADLSPTQPFQIKARDGLELHGYVTVPKNRTSKRLVVMPHGGPLGIRDGWSFDPLVQWLAINGYAVLQVNFRGSGGYGTDFIEAGIKTWGDKMQDDVTDATRWAIEQGYADASSVCLFGASYGGYAALMGVVKEPDLYRCAIGYAGVYDLETFRKKTRIGAVIVDSIVGGDDEARLKRISPALHAAEIKVPIMLVHGGKDDRCPPQQYYEMRDALIAAGKPAELLFKPGEGHGFKNAANTEELMTRVVEFLDASLGVAPPAKVATAQSITD